MSKRKFTQTQAILLAVTMAAGTLTGIGTVPTNQCSLHVKAEAKKTASDLQNPTISEDNVTTWDCIWFGNYYQSDAEGKLKDPIKWRVLSVDGDDAFLFADKALEQMEFCQGTILNPEPNEWGIIERTLETDTLTWENCTLRSFLNGYGSDENITKKDYAEDNFIDVAFTEEEQKAILTTTVTADENTDKHSPQGNDTEDKIYLLSAIETKKEEYGFKIDASRRYYNTPNYTFAGGRSGKRGKIGISQETGYAWWTRTSGQEYSGRYVFPVTISHWGVVEYQGSYGDSPGCGVRPVMHVDLSKAEGLWEYAGTVNSDGTLAEENAKEPAVPTATGTPDKTKEPEQTLEPTEEPTASPKETKEPDKTVEPKETPKVTKEPDKTVEPKETPKVTNVPDKTKAPTETAKATKAPDKTEMPKETSKATNTPSNTTLPTNMPTNTIVPTEQPASKYCVLMLDLQGGNIKETDIKSEYKVEVLENTNVKLDTIKPVKKTYVFEGWYTEPVGGSKVTELTMSKDTTLYAHWKKVVVAKGSVSKVQNKLPKKAVVIIKKISGAKGYELVYADNRKFQNAKKKIGTQTTITLSRLKKGKIYYVKVRAYKKDSTGNKVYGTYSIVKKVKITK